MWQVGYRYYMGVFAFLREDYKIAETEFEFCLSNIKAGSTRQIEYVLPFISLYYITNENDGRLILNHLIPLHLLRGILPSPRLLQSYPNLEILYTPFIKAFKTGDVKLYDQALIRGEKRLMERGTYLIVEKAREGAVRGLMKKAFVLFYFSVLFSITDLIENG